jgi:hypothetical protein
MRGDRTKMPPDFVVTRIAWSPRWLFPTLDKASSTEPEAIAAAWAHHDRIKAEALREAAAYCGPTQHMTYAELLVRADALDPPGETTDR